MNCCRQIEPLLFAERDRSLSATEQARLDRHMADCPFCRQARRALVAVDTWQAEIAATPAPDPLREWQKLRHRLRAEETAPAWSWRTTLTWGSLPLAAAATFALLFGLRSPSPAPNRVAAPAAMARAEFVEAGDASASTLVYVDQQSGWLIVWADNAAGTPG